LALVAGRTARALVMLTMHRVSSICTIAAPVAGVGRAFHRLQTVFLGNRELIRLTRTNRQPPPLLVHDLTGQTEFEIAVAYAIVNLRDKAAEGVIER